MRRWKIFYVKIRLNMWEDPNNLFDFHLLLNLKGEHWVTYVIAQSGRLIPLRSRAESFPFSFLHRALTMSPEQSQYIWRKTIPHIEVGMGSGVFTSHRSARFVLISDWWTRRKLGLDFLTRPRLRVLWTLRPPATSGSKLAPYVGCPFPLFIIIR